MDKSRFRQRWQSVDLNNDLIPESVLAKTQKKTSARRRRAKETGGGDITESAVGEITAMEAEKRAVKQAGARKDSSNEVLRDGLLYYPHRGIPTLARKIIVKTTKPITQWNIYLDANTGEVLYKNNQLKDANGKGRIFNPNPVVTLNDTTLKDIPNT